MSIDHFPPNVLDHLGWYIYRLVDPRNGQTFYVGKGQDNRVFDHVRCLPIQQNDDDVLSLKHDIIAVISKAGHKVKYFIHRHGIKDPAIAYLLEASLIDAYPDLSNLVGGHGSSKYGCRTVEQLIELYATEEARFKHDVI